MDVPQSPQPSNGTGPPRIPGSYVMMAAATMFKNGNLTEEQRRSSEVENDVNEPQAKLDARNKALQESMDASARITPQAQDIQAGVMRTEGGQLPADVVRTRSGGDLSHTQLAKDLGVDAIHVPSDREMAESARRAPVTNITSYYRKKR